MCPGRNVVTEPRGLSGLEKPLSFGKTEDKPERRADAKPLPATQPQKAQRSRQHHKHRFADAHCKHANASKCRTLHQAFENT